MLEGRRRAVPSWSPRRYLDLIHLSCTFWSVVDVCGAVCLDALASVISSKRQAHSRTLSLLSLCVSLRWRVPCPPRMVPSST